MIPQFSTTGNLPPGLHKTSWHEFASRFGRSRHRRTLLQGLEKALGVLKGVGCKRAYIDGSFVTRKRKPADFDGCWDTDGVDVRRLDPVLLSFDHRRAGPEIEIRRRILSRAVDGGRQR